MPTLVARATQRAQIYSKRDNTNPIDVLWQKNNSNPRYSRPHILNLSFQGRGFSIIILNNSQNLWRWLGEPTGYVSIFVCVWVWVCVSVSVHIILCLLVCGWSVCVSGCVHFSLCVWACVFVWGKCGWHSVWCLCVIVYMKLWVTHRLSVWKTQTDRLREGERAREGNFNETTFESLCRLSWQPQRAHIFCKN